MHRKTTQRICLTLLLCQAVFISGCWDYRELNQLALINGAGIDQGSQPGQIRLTVQLIRPSSPNEGEGKKAAQKFIVKSQTGKNIMDAVAKFTSDTARTLYWSHNQLIIFGQRQARQGVAGLTDFFVRNNEPRPTTWILVADGLAADVFKIPGQFSEVSSVEIGQLIQTQGDASLNAQINLQDFVSRLMSKTTAPIAPLIRINKAKQLSLTGTAVFKKNRLVGRFNQRQTRGMLWVLGKAQRGVITVKTPGGNAGLEIIHNRSRIKPIFDHGKVKFKIQVWADSNLYCQNTPQMLITPPGMRSLNRRQATAIRNEILAALAQAQTLNADVFGLGDIVHLAKPARWRAWEPQWNRLFPRLEMEVDVRSNIRLVGLSIPPPAPQPEKRPQ